MGQMIVTDLGREALLGSAINFANMQLFLFQDPTTIDRTLVDADITEADFSGYGAESVVYGAPEQDIGGEWVRIMPSKVFAHNGGGTANTIWGWGARDISSSHIWWAKIFDAAPVTFATAGDFRTLNSFIILTQPGT